MEGEDVALSISAQLKALRENASRNGHTIVREFGDEAVRAKTSKGRAEWFSLLDQWGRKEKGHTLTAEHLRGE